MILGFLLVGCTKNKSAFIEDFETMPSKKIWKREIVDSSRAIIKNEFGKSGNSIELILLPQDGKGKDNKKFRAEIHLSEINDPKTYHVYYQWSFYIPKNQKIDENNLHRQTIIAQIHSKPKPGNNWNDYKKTNPFNRPSIALGLTKEEDGIYVNLKYGLNGKKNTKYAHLKWKEIARLKIKRGEWYDVLFEVNFSLNDDGYISAKINQEPFTPFNGTDYKVYGANMHNESSNYFKFGLYRYWKNSSKQSVFLDQFKMWENIEGVE